MLGLVVVRRLVILVVWARHRAPHPCRDHLVVAHCCRVWAFIHVGFGAFVLCGRWASLCGLSLALGTCRGCHVATGRGHHAAWCGWWCRLRVVGVKPLGVVGVVKWALWMCPSFQIIVIEEEGVDLAGW